MAFAWTIYIVAIYISAIYIVCIYIFLNITAVETIEGIWFRSITCLPQSPVTDRGLPFSQNKISFCSCCFCYCKNQSLIINTVWF